MTIRGMDTVLAIITFRPRSTELRLQRLGEIEPCLKTAAVAIDKRDAVSAHR
jgi:hypothetical protein